MEHTQPAKCDTSGLFSLSPHYLCQNHPACPKKMYWLHEVVGPTSKLGFMLQEWDGVLSPSLRLSKFLFDNLHRTPMPILDHETRLVAIPAGHPDDDCWPDLCKQAADMFEEAWGQCQIPIKASRHLHGHFAALRPGVLHSSGQKAPGNLQNSPQNNKILAELIRSGEIQDLQWVSTTCTGKPLLISPGATGVLATWTPDLHTYYPSALNALHMHNRSLKRTFPTSVFAATMYNLGPWTICFKHTDFTNLAFSMCAVTAFGNFDPKKSGHLILWECGLVIEFPPGSTILLPSATILHLNVTVDSHERRYSFTQYVAGELFCWVENRFQ